MLHTSIPTLTRSQRITLALLPPLATACIRLLCATLRFQTVAAPTATPADLATSADLYPFWHDTLLLAAYRYRNLGIHILISQSFDGELIARIVQRLGFVPVRGSSSRGGAAGLLALTRALQRGSKCAITVDGPRGPRQIVKPGAAAAAIHAGATSLSPFHLHPTRAWRLGSWDRFLIPKPFARVTCHWPAPIPVQGTTLSITAALQHTLDRVSQENSPPGSLASLH